MSILSIVNLLAQVLGGLALFLLGMKSMGDGLNKAAGEKMKRVLAFCTGNRFSGLLAGTGVTCLTQSSSVTTVIVVGFINAGLISLTQAIGLIFGANIGKTVTVQIVAFNVSWIALPAIALGFALTFISWRKLRGWGDGILGFGLIFFGMAVMSAQMKELSTTEEFRALFSLFDCAPVAGTIPFVPLLGAIVVGTVATMVVQSSAATTAIVIVLGMNGVIGLETCLALTMGSNVGTTITAQLASITANRVAKQAALAHTLFNLIGVAIFIIAFYIPAGSGKSLFIVCVEWISPAGDLPRQIANGHTFFNIATALILLPFVAALAWICEKVLPVSEKIKYQYLEPRLLDTPSLALDQVVFTLRKMITKANKLVKLCINDIFIPIDVSDELITKMQRREEKVDGYQSEIMSYLTEVMNRDMVALDSMRVPPLIHCTNDAERVGDSAENISDLAQRMRSLGKTFSPEATEELKKVSALIEAQILGLIAVFEKPALFNPDENAYYESQIRAIAAEMERTHTQRMAQGKCSVDAGIIFLEFSAQTIAISRHISNIYNRVQRIL
ncbi:MAG: Na/Pi cotransporter family protein [Opitutales bacterium]|nr:Na/Pi cotransporter family protein [Opitutales bacterium]